MTSTSAGRVYAALLSVQIMFAVQYVVAKVLLEAIPPGAWAAIRLLTGTSIFLAVYVAGVVGRRGSGEGREGGRGSAHGRVTPRDLALLAVFSFFGVVLNQICFIEGLARTTPSHSALINTTIPVATLLFAVLLGREPLRASSALGIGLAMAGVLLLLKVDRLEPRAEWFVGDLLTQVNAASFSLFLVISRDTIRRIGPIPATAGVFCFGSLGVALYGGSEAMRVDPAELDGVIWAIAIYIVLFPTVLSYFLNYWALARVESSRVALFVYLQPLIASALSVAFLGEPLTLRLFVSSALVFAGVLFASRVPVRAGSR